MMLHTNYQGIRSCGFRYEVFFHVFPIKEGLGEGGGSGIQYSLKIKPIIHLIKILSYSLKYDKLFIKSKKDDKEI